MALFILSERRADYKASHLFGGGPWARAGPPKSGAAHTYN